MTLQEVIRQIEIIASHQPTVNMVVENDIFRLNNYADARYGVFGWTQGTHSTSVDNGLLTYQFTFFYVDRLRNDKANQIEVQSVGIETLDNIIREMDRRGLPVDTSYSFTTFNQRFMDECAGVFCSVAVVVPIGSLCGEEYGDFDENDFNEDFMIY